MTIQEQIDQARNAANAARQAAIAASSPYLDARGQPTSSPAQAATGADGRPVMNPGYDATGAGTAKSQLSIADSYDALAKQLQDRQDAENRANAPKTTIANTSGGGLVQVTTRPAPQVGPPAPAEVSTLVPGKDENSKYSKIGEVAGVGVYGVDKDGHFGWIYQKQGLTPAEQVDADYKASLDYANWLNAQTNSGQLDEKKREALWTEQHQAYTDTVQQAALQMEAQKNLDAIRANAGSHEIQRQKAANDFGSQLGTLEEGAFPYMTGPDFGQHVADTYAAIGRNPSAGMSNLKFTGSDFNFTAPDPVALARAGAAQALAGISPYAQLQLPNGSDASGAVAGLPTPPTPTPATTAAPVVPAYGASSPPANYQGGAFR